MKKSDISTIQDARDYVMENRQEGVSCPCCDQLVKMYARKLNTGMAYSLIRVARAFPNGEWVHVENFSKSSSKAAEFSKLRFWGLVESKRQRKEDGNSAGLWRVTSKGHCFVNRGMTVPARVQIYNNQFYGFSQEEIDIVKALGQKFNYYELMRATL